MGGPPPFKDNIGPIVGEDGSIVQDNIGPIVGEDGSILQEDAPDNTQGVPIIVKQTFLEPR